MAKTTQVVATIGVTKNLGNYNSARYEFRETVDVEDGDDVDEVRKGLWKTVEAQVEAQLDGS